MENRTGEHIEIKLTITRMLTRWPCHVCGGCTEKVSVLAESECGLRVCEQCLEAGDIDARLEAYAASLERCAAETRALIGRLRVPSFAEYGRFNERVRIAERAAEMCNSQTEYERVLTDDSVFAQWRERFERSRREGAAARAAFDRDPEAADASPF
jgi:hypothetical protein